MNISAAENNIARSIQDMGNLLKNVTNQSMDMGEKMLKVSVTEQVQQATDPFRGGNLDMMA